MAHHGDESDDHFGQGEAPPESIQSGAMTAHARPEGFVIAQEGSVAQILIRMLPGGRYSLELHQAMFSLEMAPGEAKITVFPLLSKLS
jgi:hypothetical protein